MKVILREDLFSDEAVGYTPFLLHSLFHACLGSRHVLLPEFDPEQCVTYRAWRNSLSQIDGDAVEMAFRSSLQAEARETIDCVVVATTAGTDWTVSPPCVGPDDLTGLLHAPLIILVENEVNDGAFLRAVAFGVDGDVFRRYLQNGRIRFDHAGGSSMRSLVEERGRDRLRAHRMWAVFDSDALVPNHPSSEAQDKVNACAEVGIRHHVLRRRSIENYLPADEIDQATPQNHKDLSRRKTVGAFRRLRPEQRAHYCLKGGFDADRPRLGPGGHDAGYRPAVESLFFDVSPADRAALAGGFGKHIAALFVPAPDRGHPGISEAARRKDGQDREMVPLFRDILRSL